VTIVAGGKTKVTLVTPAAPLHDAHRVHVEVVCRLVEDQDVVIAQQTAPRGKAGPASRRDKHRGSSFSHVRLRNRPSANGDAEDLMLLRHFPSKAGDSTTGVASLEGAVEVWAYPRPCARATKETVTGRRQEASTRRTQERSIHWGNQQPGFVSPKRPTPRPVARYTKWKSEAIRRYG